MDSLKHFQKHQTLYMVGGLSLFLTVNAIVLATSRIMEEVSGESGRLPFEVWEPFLWEFSSAVMLLALFPIVNCLLKSRHISWETPVLSILTLLLGSVVFSVAHVTGMVAIREFIYWIAGSNYRFGNVWFGFLYEYRKDFLTFFLVIGVIKSYQFIVSRLRGEANLVRYGEEKITSPDRILIKKLGKEFIVKVSDIDWLESSGNYINLHIDARVYPTRNTMSALIPTLKQHGFCRVHRSYGVNLERVESIEVLENGSGNLKLTTGKTLPMSRRYRDELKKRLNR